MTAAEGFALGVDLGTSHTVAVLRWPDGRSRPLLFDGVPLLPSAVYLDPNGALHVGRDALRMAALDPARLEPNPKRRIDEATVLLGVQEVSTVDILAAVLATVARAAVEAVGFLHRAVLTYPASWGPARRAVLAGAAAKAGWPPPWLVPEPVAAAPCGDNICVLDLTHLDVNTAQVVAVKPGGGSNVAWSMKTPRANLLTPLGDGVMVQDTNYGEEKTVVFGPGGKDRLADRGKGKLGVRLAPGSVLLFSGSPGTSPADQSLFGFGLSRGDFTPLGQAEKVRSAGCSWNTHLLVCPSDSDCGVWRVAT